MTRPRSSTRDRRRAGVPALALLVAAAAGGAASPTAAQPPAGSAPGQVVLTGLLADETTRPLAHHEVLACLTTTCFFGETGADGRFRFELRLRVPAQLAIKTQEAPEARPRRGAALAPLLVAAPSHVDAGVVYVPHLPDSPVAPLTGADGDLVPAGDGLALAIRLADLRPLPGKVVAGIAARRMQPAQVPRYRLPDSETVIAVYALHPFGTTSASPIALRVSSSLPAGSRVRFRTIREIDGSFSQPVPGSATGTHLVTDAGTGIAELTHLIITR